jgi:hypothetical protein
MKTTNKAPSSVLKLPLEERAAMAFKAAVKKAIAERMREGLPVYVSSNGKVIDLAAKTNGANTSRRASRPAVRRRRPRK